MSLASWLVYCPHFLQVFKVGRLIQSGFAWPAMCKVRVVSGKLGMGRPYLPTQTLPLYKAITDWNTGSHSEFEYNNVFIITDNNISIISNVGLSAFYEIRNSLMKYAFYQHSLNKRVHRSTSTFWLAPTDRLGIRDMIGAALVSLHWMRVSERIQFKIAVLTYSHPRWRTTVPGAVHLYCWYPWSTGTAFCRNQSAGCASS